MKNLERDEQERLTTDSMNKSHDEWGPALGADEPTEPEPRQRKKKNTLSSLVSEFSDRLLVNPATLYNAQTNAPAMMKAFRQLLDSGKTHDDIRQMIKQFHKDIVAKPLTDGIPAWRAFLGRLDSLALKVTHSEPSYDYDEQKVDPRLVNDND